MTNVKVSWGFWTSGILRCVAGVYRSRTFLVYYVPSKLRDLSTLLLCETWQKTGILNSNAAETSFPANAGLFGCLFPWRYNPVGRIFHSPVSGFSLLVFEVSWSHTNQFRALASSFSRFLDHTQRLVTVGRTPLGEWSIRRRDLYLTTHNTHNRQISMPPVGFEPTIAAGERPKTYALDLAATGTGIISL